jgi:zinc transport system permease protein
MDFFSTISTALSFDFFLRSLVAGVFLAFICGFVGNYTVIRREVMIAHTISNVAFLAVTIAAFASFNMNLALALSAFLSAIALSFLQRGNFFSKASVLEFTGQIAIGTGVIVLSQVSTYQIDLTQVLFGDILLITRQDLYLIFALTSLVAIVFGIFSKDFFRLAFGREIARAQGVNVEFVNFIYLLMVCLTVVGALKIVGVILIGAFLVIPPNIAKIMAGNFRQMNWLSAFIGAFSTVCGLFISFAFDWPSGATIIFVMGIALIAAIAIKNGKSKMKLYKFKSSKN